MPAKSFRAEKIQAYLSRVRENELIEYADAAAQVGEISTEAAGVLKLALDYGVSELSPKQLTLLHEGLVKRIDKECDICGDLIEPFVFRGDGFDQQYCSYHNSKIDRD